MRKRIVSRRLLAVLLALSMCLSLLPVTALAEEETQELSGVEAVPLSGENWKAVKWAEIQSGETYAITMTKSDEVYILPSASSTNKNPSAVRVELAGDKLMADVATYGWTFTEENEGYIISNGENYLSPAYGKTNGSRVGNTQAVWTLHSTGNYLSTPDTSDSTTTWCLGVYLTTDWRTYKTDPTTNNIKDETLTLWHLLSGTEIEPPAETKVETPEANPANGSSVAPGTAVKLSCATKDVTYQTSTDGMDWANLTGSEFTIPEDASGTYSIKVRAVKDGLEDSDVLELSYTILSMDGVVDIAEARKGQAGDTFTVTGVVTCDVGNGNVYIQDATGGICLYKSGLTAEVGKTVTATGTWTDYSGLLELANPTITVIGDGTLPTPKNYTIADAKQVTAVTSADQGVRVKITDAEVTAVTTNNVTISDGTNTINIYRCPTVDDLAEGAKLDVIAVVSTNRGVGQLLVASASDITITAKAPDPGPGPDDPGEELYKPANGDKVAFYYAADKLVMTGEASGTRLKGAEVPLSGGKLFTGDALILTANVDADGYYTFTASDGKVLNTGATGSNLTLVNAADAVCAKWELTAAASGTGWLIRSTEAAYNGNKNQYIEYYSGFTTYSLKDGADQGIYTMQFVKEENVQAIDWTVDAEIEQTIAQWGGALKAYENPQSVTSINGDLIAVGDELDNRTTYQVIIGGQPAMTLANSTPPNYYMGGTGLGTGDYPLFTTSSKGWGGMKLSFRLRGTNAAPGDWTVQFSTDGTSWSDFSTGSYSAAYTSYGGGSTGEAVNISGNITDGVARTSLAAAQYVSFTFDVPVGAENAETLYIRLLGGSTRTNGNSGNPSGNIRVDTVKLAGSPVVSDRVTPYVGIEPDSSEDVGAGTEIKLTAASGATVHYGWADNTTGAVNYTEGTAATVPETLPATLFVYATSNGKDNSVTRKMTYLPASVSAVVMNPSSAGVFLGGATKYVTLTTATEGATIYYSLGKKDDGGNLIYEVYDQDTAKIELKPGFGTLTVYAYAEMEGFTTSAVTSRTYTERSSENYQLFFGQMHSHTSYSDGAGTAAQAFDSVRKLDQDTWNMDFLSVTDHSNSFDDAGGTKRLSDAPTGNEWNEGKRLASDITDGEFVGIFGYEMTWSNGLGHINTFNTPGYQDRTQSSYTTYSTALQNYYEELKTVPASISQFNHPGTTFGDFSDFAHYDEEIDQLITLIEVGNGEGAIGSSGYFPSYEYYTRALDKGWHVAPTNNQDNHKGGWGTANTGRDVVLVDELTEEAIYDAMRNYRVYATEDLNLEIYYTFDGNVMGSILDAGGYGSGSKAVISVDLKDPNNESAKTVQVIVNGGKVLTEQKNVACNEDGTTVTFEIDNPADYSYYYIKITQEDSDIAVTAPVWVGKVEAVGITSLRTTSDLTVVDQEQGFVLDLYNNENRNLEIDSIEFTDKATGRVLHTTTDVTRVPRMGTATTAFRHTFTTDGSVTVTATVKASLNGVEKIYTQDLELKVMPKEVVSKIVVDGTHYNDYVTGYYGGNMGNMTSIAAALGVEVAVKRDRITAADLEDCQMLVISAPARKAGTANAGDYTASLFEDSFIQLVKEYLQSGGMVVVCGLADYQDRGGASSEHQASVQQNKLLEALGSTMRINDDEAYDQVHNGGQEYRLYPELFNMDSRWCKGIVTPENVAEGETYQTYSQYSGCTVDPGNGTWLVKGFESTYSIDSDKDGNPPSKGTDSKGNSIAVEEGNAYFLVCEEVGSGMVFAAGGVFLSDFEVKAELDNIWDLPYANRTIFENMLSAVREGIAITPIAETRKAPLNKVFTIEGWVTNGTTNPDTTFFDSIYVQDETGGTDVFPYATTGLAIGTKVRVLGYTDAYQGDRELQVISLEILDAPAKIYEPRALTTAQATDYTSYGGQLVKTSGIVSSIVMAGGRVSQFKLTDNSGIAATVFIDGYITNPEGVNNVHTWLKNGQTVTAAGLLYSHPEGDSDVSVPVLRVRNCDEIVNVSSENPVKPSGSGSGGGSSSVRKVSVSATRNGSVSVSPSNPAAGAKVSLTVRPDSGYVLDSIKVLDSKGAEVELTANGENKFTFTMPSGKVTVDAKFVSESGDTSAPSFSDVSSDHWAKEEIAWAAEKGIMQGVGGGSFAPERTVTRQQLWMVMARASGFNPADMTAACAWAKSNSISDGTRPGESLTRQQMVAMLYRYAQLMGYPVSETADPSTFPDYAAVSNYAKDAMAWAAGSGIVTGTSDGLLNPGGTATRAQFVVILHRFCVLYGIA